MTRLPVIDTQKILMNNVHFKSSEVEWETPESVFKPLQKEFNITLDTCASSKNAKCKRYIDKNTNSLSTMWLVKEGETCWMNPPYGRGIDKWIKKAHNETMNGTTTVALVPARTDTSWFHNYIHDKQEVRFIRGRIKFVDAKSSAPFPSMVVIFRPTKKEKEIKKTIKKSIWKRLKW